MNLKKRFFTEKINRSDSFCSICQILPCFNEFLLPKNVHLEKFAKVLSEISSKTMILGISQFFYFLKVFTREAFCPQSIVASIQLVDLKFQENAGEVDSKFAVFKQVYYRFLFHSKLLYTLYETSILWFLLEKIDFKQLNFNSNLMVKLI